MTVPFGFSVGDFVAGIGLVRDVIDALQSSSSSTSRYRGLIYELFALERALLEVKKLSLDDDHVTTPKPPDIEALHQALQFAAVQCQRTIDKLLVKVKKYEGHLTANGSRSRWKDALRKVQWALLTDKDLEESRAEIRSHASSIRMLLHITQIATTRLQTQKCSQDQMQIARWLQWSYNQSMSALTGTLAGIGRTSQKVLETTGALVHSNHQIFQKVIQIQQDISELPQNPGYGDAIVFVDAFGKETRFYLDFVYSATVMEDWLKRRFEEIGYEKILNREYALEDLKTKRQINLSRDWQTQLYPGMYLGMDMIYERHEDQLLNCPGCQSECIGATDDDIKCPNCGVHFRRVEEVPDFKSDAYDSTRPQELASTTRILPQSRYQKHDSETPQTEKELILMIKRFNREREQIKAFRRFRFQATRAESELAILNPFLAYIVLQGNRDNSPEIQADYGIAEAFYRQEVQTLEGNENPPGNRKKFKSKR